MKNKIFTIFIFAALVLLVGCKFNTKPKHSHTFLETWEYDGNYHWHVAECHPEATDTKLPHDFTDDDWSVYEDATTETEGTEERFCSTCNFRQTRSIPKLPYAGTKLPNEARALCDIVFEDGSSIPYSTTLELTDDQKSKAVGIVGYVNEEGTEGLIVGLKFANNIPFAKTKPNYSTTVNSINTSFTYTSGQYVFKGDIDGSDNLEFFQSVDSNATTNLATYYPALNFACNYGTNNNFTGDFKDGWYLPALKELHNICSNIGTIENTREKAGETKVSFIENVDRSNPGGNDYTYSYYFLSSNLRKGTLSSEPYYNVFVESFKEDSSSKIYTYAPVEYSEITKGDYSSSTGGGSEGYTYKSYYTFAMAVHKFSNTSSTPETPAITYFGQKEKPDSLYDIIFSDGSATAYDDSLVLSDEEKSAAIAVVFSVYGTKICAIGKNFNSGDTWSNCSTWCKNYGKTYSITNFEESWSMPTKADMLSIYNKKTNLANALAKIDGSNFGTGNTNYYWSSTVGFSENHRVWVNFYNGGTGGVIPSTQTYKAVALLTIE